MILIEPKLKICNLNFSKIIKRNLCICFIVRYFSCVQLFATPQMVAYQALPSMGFSRQEYWIGLPFPSPADLPNPGIEPGLLHCRPTVYRLIKVGSKSSF